MAKQNYIHFLFLFMGLHQDTCSYRVSLFSVSVRSYGKTKLYTLSISLYGTPSRHVFIKTSLVVMWMRFELVVHKKSEIWASLPYSFTKKVLLQLPGE